MNAWRAQTRKEEKLGMGNKPAERFENEFPSVLQKQLQE
jgi:hypothetical protein